MEARNFEHEDSYTRPLSEHTTAVVASDFAQCRHVTLWRINPYKGRQRWKCARCRKSFTDERVKPDSLTITRTLGPMYRDGVGRNEAARMSGYCNLTVTRYYRRFRSIVAKMLEGQID